MNRPTTVVVLFAFLFFACNQEEGVARLDLKDLPNGEFISESYMVDDYYEGKGQNKIHSEVTINGDQISYRGFKDGKLQKTRTGHWDRKQRRVYLDKANDLEPFPVKDVEDNSFKMKYGPKLLLFSRK
jgi:hypothetical protein